MKKRLFAILAVLLALTLGACASAPEKPAETGGAPAAPAQTQDEKAEEPKEEPKELPVLRVGIVPYLSGVAADYAMVNGFDEEEGFKIELSVFPFGGPLAEALGSRQIDIGCAGSGALPAVINYDCTMVAEQSEADFFLAAMVRPDSEIATVKGANPTYPELLGDADTVRGKTILSTVGTNNHFMCLQWLEKLGLKESDVNIVNMDPTQCYSAFKVGEGDVAVVTTPQFYTARDTDGFLVAANLKLLDIPMTDLIIATNEIAAEQEDLVVKFIKCILRANDELNADLEHRFEYVKEFNKKNGMEVTDEALRTMTREEVMISSENAANREFAAWLAPMCDYYVVTGKFEADAVDAALARCTNTLLVKALDQLK